MGTCSANQVWYYLFSENFDRWYQIRVKSGLKYEETLKYMFDLGAEEQRQDFDNEKKLIRSLKKMDEAAITWVWQSYYPALLRYCTRMINDVNLADEIVSITFERFLKTIHKGKGPNKNVRSYLYRMAYNAIVDEHRALTRFAVLEEENHISNDSPKDAFDLANQTEIIKAALSQLTDDQHDLVILRFVEGLTMKETAKIMSKTINSIKTLQMRALRRLRKTPEFIEMGMTDETK